MPGSRPTWYLTHEYLGRDQTCDLQELQVAPLTVPLFLEGRLGELGRGITIPWRVIAALITAQQPRGRP